jgi:CRP-like cAMP-binding protein
MEEHDLREYLRKFLSSINELSLNEKEILSQKIRLKFFRKGELLFKESEINTDCFFVLKGCLRQYSLIDGNEKTTAFYIEYEAAALFNSIKNQCKSDSNLVCVEDCILIIGNPEEEQNAYKEFPKLAEITRKMMEQDFGKLQSKMAFFISSTAEERYLDIMKNQPQLLQRVPQHQIASYIGVSPESLSRIRKRMNREL